MMNLFFVNTDRVEGVLTPIYASPNLAFRNTLWRYLQALTPILMYLG